MRPFSGKQKLTIAQRLGPNWPDLADYFDLPPGERQRFQPGREAQGIWEWLESRQRLTQLPEALRYIDRDDLALELEPPACAPAHTTLTGWTGSPFPGLRHFTAAEGPALLWARAGNRPTAGALAAGALCCRDGCLGCWQIVPGGGGRLATAASTTP